MRVTQNVQKMQIITFLTRLTGSISRLLGKYFSHLIRSRNTKWSIKTWQTWTTNKIFLIRTSNKAMVFLIFDKQKHATLKLREPDTFWYFHASLLENLTSLQLSNCLSKYKKPEDEWIFHFPTSVTSGSVGWTNQENIHLNGQECLTVMEEGAEKSQQKAEECRSSFAYRQINLLVCSPNVKDISCGQSWTQNLSWKFRFDPSAGVKDDISHVSTCLLTRYKPDGLKMPVF